MQTGKEKSDERLFDPAKVDVCSVSGDGVVELVIVQDHPWTGSDAHVESLQQKIQTYVSYALDGQMVADFPQTAGLT